MTRTVAQRTDAPVIDLDGVVFAWPGAAPVLDVERLEVARGERVFLAGPSGSGKTTLLNLVAGVVLPVGGAVSVLGTRIDRLGAAARDRFRADHIGFVFQLFNLVPYLSVIDNVTLPCRFSPRRRARAAGRGASLRDAAIALLGELGMAGADVIDRPVTALSVGQQQRVAAARALIGSPEVVVADEPTSSLDADMRAAFVGLLFQQCAAEGTSLLFVSHDRSLAPLFDRTIDLPGVNRAGVGHSAQQRAAAPARGQEA